MTLHRAQGSFDFEVKFDQLSVFFSRVNHHETPLFAPGWKLFLTHQIADPAFDDGPPMVGIAVSVPGMSKHLWGDVSVFLTIKISDAASISKKCFFHLDGRPQLSEALTFPRAALWDSNFSVRRNDYFIINVHFAFAPEGIPASMKPTLSNALTKTMRGQEFIDTMFILFSRVSGTTKRVYSPIPVFACSDLLHTPDSYFENLLRRSGFLESNPVEIHTYSVKHEDQFTDDYDYSADSDLEDDVRDIPLSKETDRPFVAGRASTPASVKKVVHVKDTAMMTWRSLIFYLYSGDITFAPLRSTTSTQSRRKKLEEFRKLHPGNPPPCSPKSMYRLADKLGIDVLRRLALEQISAQLTEHSAIEELFSVFTSRYDEVATAELEYISEHWHMFKHSSELRNKLDEVATGAIPHGGRILSLLLARTAIL